MKTYTKLMCLLFLLVGLAACGLPKKVETAQGSCTQYEPNFCLGGNMKCYTDKMGCRVCGCPEGKGHLGTEEQERAKSRVYRRK